MMNNAVEVEDLHVRRGATTVFRSFDLTLRAGGITGILGPSGCGKTTLLRTIAGVQLTQGGTVRVLEHVGLGDQARQLAGTLSGGQLKRLSLAVALLGNPELLVLDEPTVGLDPVLREELWTLFRGLTAAGMTLIVSSHVMDEALRCDDLVLLRAGQLVARTTPAELAAQTGQSDPDAAFLELIRRAARDPQGIADDDAPAPRRHGRHAAGDEVAS